jgi:hypothetical protein
MGSHLVDGCFLGRLPHDPPNHLLGNARAPDSTAVGDTAEDKAVFDVSDRQPVNYGSLYPEGIGTVRTCPPFPNRSTMAQ